MILYVASFQDPFLLGLWNATDQTQIAPFVGIWKKTATFSNSNLWKYLKYCYFFTESATFPGKFPNLLLLG